MTIIQSILLGIIEGITEFLPISSTGHLILASKLMALEPSPYLTSFEIFIQLGAILAVVVLYARNFLVDMAVWKRILASFIPTAIIGLAGYKFIKAYLLTNAVGVSWALLIGGILIIVFERWYRPSAQAQTDIRQITYRAAVFIGVCQSLAMIPGVSRSAATILGGLALGIGRKAIVEYSFLLAVPTMCAAVGLDLVKTAHVFEPGQMVHLGIGFVTAFVTAIVAIRWLLRFIQTHNFVSFGVYRIILSGLFLLFFFGGK